MSLAKGIIIEIVAVGMSYAFWSLGYNVSLSVIIVGTILAIIETKRK